VTGSPSARDANHQARRRGLDVLVCPASRIHVGQVRHAETSERPQNRRTLTRLMSSNIAGALTGGGGRANTGGTTPIPVAPGGLDRLDRARTTRLLFTPKCCTERRRRTSRRGCRTAPTEPRPSPRPGCRTNGSSSVTAVPATVQPSHRTSEANGRGWRLPNMQGRAEVHGAGTGRGRHYARGICRA
jgi:hypothetical protein